MFWSVNSINVYKCWLKISNFPRPTIITAHCVPAPGSPFRDNTTQAAIWMGSTYGAAATHLCCGLGGEMTSYAVTVCAPRTGTAEDFFHAGSIGGPENNVCPEASFIIRRVGAGSVRLVAGRARFGPLHLDLFTDPPRYRKLNPLDPRVVAATSILLNAQVGATYGMLDVLWNRVTGEAVEVGSYFTPWRAGRVWARAGVLQGHRGPSRGGTGYGKKNNR
jgi:hypothetical protein